MQSSTAIAFRALVMLIFLISVPLLAIFGRDLPEVIKGLLDGRLTVQLSEQPQAAIGSDVAAPMQPRNVSQAASNPFAESAPYRAAPATAPGHAGPGVATPGLEQSPVMNAGMNAPVSAPAFPAANQPQAEQPAHSTMPANPAAFQVPTESRPISPQETPAANHVASEPPKEPPTTTNDDQFRRAENRLRELGATHYKLETWGAQNERYRFECRMAVGGNVGVNRHFEAVEDDPWRAMEAVLRQVEEWQTSSL